MRFDGERLAEARASAGLTQDELVAKVKKLDDRVGLDRSRLSAIENGRTNPGYRLGCMLALSVNVSPHYLADITDDPWPGFHPEGRERDNLQQYLRLSKDEQAIIIDGIADFLRARALARGQTTGA